MNLNSNKTYIDRCSYLFLLTEVCFIFKCFWNIYRMALNEAFINIL